MNVYVSWCYYDRALEASQAENPVPTPELDALQQALQGVELTPRLRFTHQLLAVHIAIPALRKAHLCRAATRAADSSRSVAQIARVALQQTLGDDLDLKNPQSVRLIGLTGLRELFAVLAVQCAVLELTSTNPNQKFSLPYEFWAENDCFVELPVAGPASVLGVLRGMIANDVAVESSQQLLADWGGVGISATMDMNLLLTAACGLGLQDKYELDVELLSGN